MPAEAVRRINDDRAGQPIAINLGERRDRRVRDRQDRHLRPVDCRLNRARRIVDVSPRIVGRSEGVRASRSNGDLVSGQHQVTGQRRPDRPCADYRDPVRQSHWHLCLLADIKRKMSAVSMYVLIAMCQAAQPTKTGRVYTIGRLTYLVIWRYASTIAQPANRTYERR